MIHFHQSLFSGLSVQYKQTPKNALFVIGGVILTAHDAATVLRHSRVLGNFNTILMFF